MLRLAWVVCVALAACGGKDAQSLDDGELGGHCYPNGTCNVGLSCASGVCIAADAAVIPDAAIDAAVPCDTLEPNDSMQTAWITPVDTTKSLSLSALAICPAGDKDIYSVMITTANENLEMIVVYEAGGADLQGSILISDGTAIAIASMTAANTKWAYTPNLPTGTYYVQVTGPASGTLTTNNYKLNINVTGP